MAGKSETLKFILLLAIISSSTLASIKSYKREATFSINNILLKSLIEYFSPLIKFSDFYKIFNVII